MVRGREKPEVYQILKPLFYMSGVNAGYAIKMLRPSEVVVNTGAL